MRLFTSIKVYEICVVEQRKNAINYTEHEFNRNQLLIFGNEVDGVSEKAISKSDKVIEIPMLGCKESFNVSVCVGIILSFAKGVYLSNE